MKTPKKNNNFLGEQFSYIPTAIKLLLKEIEKIDIIFKSKNYIGLLNPSGK